MSPLLLDLHVTLGGFLCWSIVVFLFGAMVGIATSIKLREGK